MKNWNSRIVWFGILKLIFFIIVVMVLFYYGKKAYALGYSVFAEETLTRPPGKTVKIVVTEGMNGAELANTLKEKKLIRDATVFRIQYMLSDYKDELIPGSYELNTSQTSEVMLAILSGVHIEESEIEGAM